MADKVRQLLRGLLKEFRYLGVGTVKNDIIYPWRNVPVYLEVKDEFNEMKNSTNDAEIKDCLVQAELYFNYLKAARQAQQLEEKYKGVGERPLDELAASVGLRLPEKLKS